MRKLQPGFSTSPRVPRGEFHNSGPGRSGLGPTRPELEFQLFRDRCRNYNFSNFLNYFYISGNMKIIRLVGSSVMVD